MDLVENQEAIVTVTATVVSPGSDVADVLADLSAIGGPAEAQMVAGVDGVWTWSGSITLPASGTYRIRFLASNMSGFSATYDLDANVLPARNNLAPALSSMAATGLLRAGQAGVLKITVVASDPDGTVKSVMANLSQVGGSAEAKLTAGTGTAWTWTGPVVPSTPGTKTIALEATDDLGGLCTGTATIVVGKPVKPPEVGKVTVTAELEVGQKASLTIDVKASDQDGTVKGVVLDLGDIGGGANLPMTLSAQGVWTFTGFVTPRTPGAGHIVITVTDNDHASKQATVDVSVAPANTLPQITNLTVAGFMTVDTPAEVTVSANVTDSTGTVQGVTADLSAIGGPPEQALEQTSDNLWTFSGTLTATTVGTQEIPLSAVDDRGAVASATGTIAVNEPLAIDLSIAGVSENQEETPGGAVASNADDDNGNGVPDRDEAGSVTGEDDLVAIRVSLAGAPDAGGDLRLEVTSGAGKVKLWSNASKGQELSLPHVWTLGADVVPSEVYLEGLAPSDAAADVELVLSYENPGIAIGPGDLVDVVRLTVLSIQDTQRHPLGSSTTLAASIVSKVYMPSRYGGTLTLDGGDIQLLYTDGSDLDPHVAIRVLTGQLEGSVVARGEPCVYTVPAGRPGWYYMRLMQGSATVVSSRFREDGEAARKPWCGWWWPMNNDVDPNLYDPGEAFDKYDQVYGTHARQWERDNASHGDSWFGHCWGWSIASILMPQPQATTKNGVYFSEDDMEGLYTELADSTIDSDPNLTVFYIPDSPLTADAGEAVDAFCDDLYTILRVTIRQDRLPVQSDMRAVADPPDRLEQVWNHGIYRYEAKFREVPGADDKRLVEVIMGVWATGSIRPPSIGASDRFEQYVYQLEFDASGEVVRDSARQNWISASHYPPHDLVRLTGILWQGNNPYLTKANVDALYDP